MLKPEDHERVHQAIAAAEAGTSGDIACVVAKESAGYREVPIAWATLVALAAPPIALLVGVRPAILLNRLQGGWAFPHPGALEGALTTGAVAYALIQLALFAVVLLVVAIPPVRRVLTPGFVERTHVHARAVELAAHRRHALGAPASVIIYASTAERRVEIVADDAIHSKVGEAAWNDVVEAAVEKIRAGDPAGGLITAIERCGQLLAQHFPAHGAPRPEPADDLTEV